MTALYIGKHEVQLTDVAIEHGSKRFISLTFKNTEGVFTQRFYDNHFGYIYCKTFLNRSDVKVYNSSFIDYHKSILSCVGLYYKMEIYKNDQGYTESMGWVRTHKTKL